MTKIPRAMRFNDRVSMRASTELREPFLDHRMFELAMRQNPERKISGGTRKKMLRDLAGRYLPRGISEAPKRPMQTPQREWLRGPLRDWVYEEVESALTGPFSAYFNRANIEDSLSGYFAGDCDNSFFVWQWVSAGMIGRQLASSRNPQLEFDAVGF
jgi:asparagine synthase (glutamine-hydrolysing)